MTGPLSTCSTLSGSDVRQRSRSCSKLSPALRPSRMPRLSQLRPPMPTLSAAPADGGATAAAMAAALSTPGCQQPLSRASLAQMPISVSKAEAGAGVPLRILCYGDSLTAGFANGGNAFEPYGRAMADTLGGLGTPCDVSVCGHSGKTASEMVASMDSGLSDMLGNWGKGLRRILREDGPFDLVLIMAGTNDIGYDHRPEAITGDVLRLHAACHELGVKTCLLPPPSAPCGDAPWHATRRQVTQRLKEWAEGMPGHVVIIDPSTIVPAAVGAAAGAAMWDPDNLHFSPAGSRRLGRELASRILPSLQRPKRPSAPVKARLRVPAAAAAPPPAARPAVSLTPASVGGLRRTSTVGTMSPTPQAAPAATVPQLPKLLAGRRFAPCHDEVRNNLPHTASFNTILVQ